MKKKYILCTLPIIFSLAGCGPIDNGPDKIIYGNIYTMDEKDTTAEAIAIKDGKILQVGSAMKIARMATFKTEEVMYDGFIYPGFIEGHVHTVFAGYRSIGQANVTGVVPANDEEYKKIIKKFIDEHPEKEMYLATGWVEDDNPKINKGLLDEICPNKPLALNTCGGHSLLLNTKAMEHFGVNKQLVETWGTELVHVDLNGDPTGYVCENPAIEILTQFPITVEDSKTYIEDFQKFAFQNGFTAVADAGAELMTQTALEAHVQLQKENKLKLRTYSYLMVKDNVDDPKAKIQEIADFAKENNGEYFKVIGAKVFLDGVLEARTSWLTENYKDIEQGQPDYHGLERFNDKEKMVELITEASKNNLAVHSHSEGDGATKFFLECIEESQKETKNKDQRNAAAHLHFVRPEDVEKFATTNTIAVVPPLWTPKIDVTYDKEVGYIGDEKYQTSYPIKSFYDAGAKAVFHTDYPVSPSFNAPLSVYSAAERCIPAGIVDGMGGPSSVNNPAEKINRKQAVEAMTKNAAYMFHEEDRLGTLEPGKIANMTVVDTDLINGNVNYLPFASILATIVDGKEVYRNEEFFDIQTLLENLYDYFMLLFYGSKYDWDDFPGWMDMIG